MHVEQAYAQTPPVFALDPPAQVYTDPLTIRIPMGRAVNVSVYVNSSTELNLYGWQMKLQWDPAILNYTSTSHTDLWNMSLGGLAVNRTTGRLIVGAASPGNVSLLDVPSALPSKVMTVTFQGIGYGLSSISITDFALMGRSDVGNGWTVGLDPYNGVSRYTEYERWPDLKVDGAINIFDAIIFADSIYSNEGDADYKSYCDFNNDSAVDNFDRAIFGSDFGLDTNDPTWPNSTYPTGLTNTIFVFNRTIQSCSVQVVIPGDVNGDNIVNILDSITVGNSFFAKPGDSNWNPNADIDGDDFINIIDAIIIGQHFLQHYP